MLVLCKSSLLDKWQEELSSSRPGRGFPRYLVGEHWPETHPLFRLLSHVRVISGRASAEELRSIREKGRLQAPNGIYIVNQNVLTEKNRESRPFLKRLYRTYWDLIIVDEAHHYARWNRPAYIFAPDGKMRNYDQGIPIGRFGKILALTATPFELTPEEMVQLLALVRARNGDLDAIEKGLDLYVRHLDRFFNLRRRSLGDSLRRDAVERLRHLRLKNALGSQCDAVGLQDLLRRYIIRNAKPQNERRYYFVNKTDGRYETASFDKLHDLQKEVKESPLLPFDGADALFYLELRDLIQETVERARDGTDRRTFITTDLRQGLSSYPQIAQSKLLSRDFDSARRLSRLVNLWNRPRNQRLHPKVQALSDIVCQIAEHEVDKVRQDPTKWFSKVLVFNKLIRGTAPHLRKVLTERLRPIFAKYTDDLLALKGLGSRQVFSSRLRACLKTELAKARKEITDLGSYHVPAEFRHEAFSERHGQHFVDAYRGTIMRRPEQDMFLIRALLSAQGTADEHLQDWLAKEVVGPFKETLRNIIDRYLDDTPDEDRPREELVEMAERECVMLMHEQQSVGVVGRYDGSNPGEREGHRRNFNGFYNPFVLLVSRVGEEGIDLQEQCRYIIHYDLEWNPAKMEQREGRVDRVGWGRADEGSIDVRFMLLKGTYEERIFHAVMQRDQWFQILIGSKRKELGQPDDDESSLTDKDVDEGNVDEQEDEGRLAPEEKEAVMMDLRP